MITDTKKIDHETAPSRAQKIVKTGDVIFGTTRPTLGRFSIIMINMMDKSVVLDFVFCA